MNEEQKFEESDIVTGFLFRIDGTTHNVYRIENNIVYYTIVGKDYEYRTNMRNLLEFINNNPHNIVTLPSYNKNLDYEIY